MSQKTKGYEAHVFICTNKKIPGKACCADKNGDVLRNEVKAAAKEKWGNRVRINAAGCLDQCENGIAAVIYPQNEWILNLKDTDSQKVIGEISKLID